MTECVYPKGNSRTNGYALMYYPPKKKGIKAHRAAWMLVNGPIPKGMVVDHICHNEAVVNEECQGGFDCIHRACINVEHLQLVTPSENSKKTVRILAFKTHCTNGHLLDDNLMYYKSKEENRSVCKTCHKERRDKSRAKLKKVGA